MNIQIFGRSKCFDTKKAERWFKERRIKFQSIDLVKYGMSGGEFDSVLRAVGGIDNLIDWTVKDSVKAQLRLDVKRILRKYHYPPDKQIQATQTILEQAELLCADWAEVS